jgi:hypothetical protein
MTKPWPTGGCCANKKISKQQNAKWYNEKILKKLNKKPFE